MSKWAEFDIYIKEPDDEILGKEGRQSKAKCNVDIDTIIAYYESRHGRTGEEGTSINLISGEDFFILIKYEDFKAKYKLHA